MPYNEGDFVKVTMEFQVVCEKCLSNLDTTWVMSDGYSRDYDRLVVRPCVKCCKEKK